VSHSPQPPPSRRQFLFLLGGAGGLASLGLIPALRSGRREKVSRTSWALGSEVSITALHEDARAAEHAINDAFAELERIEEAMSLYRPHSQICRLNRDGVLENPDPYLVAVLRAAAAMSERSDGAFDATVQPLWSLYASAQKSRTLPDPEAIRDATRRVDWRNVEVTDRRVRFRAEGMAVTLNGIAQGFASDRVRAALQARGIRHALVNTGEFGSLGRNADGAAWTVGIQHPRRADAYIALASVENRFLSTSGDYATTFSDDFRHNHIFDPRTGLSPAEFASVTVLAPTGMDADALTKVLFVRGLEQGLDLVRTVPGADALCILKDGRMVSTNGFPRVS